MFFLFSLVPTTFVVTLGYFVLFSSAKAHGLIQKFGRILAIWIFVIAVLFPLMGMYAAVTGSCPIMEMMRPRYSGTMN